MTRLLQQLFRVRRLQHVVFTVYTRADCCCCHKAIAMLREYQRSLGFQIELVDVDTDPALVAAYDTTVPVVVVDGKVRFRGIVNRPLLERLLHAESQNSAARG